MGDRLTSRFPIVESRARRTVTTAASTSPLTTTATISELDSARAQRSRLVTGVLPSGSAWVGSHRAGQAAKFAPLSAR